MYSPLRAQSGEEAQAGGTPGDAALAAALFPSPRSASAAKRTRYAQRASLSCGAGGTELVTTPNLGQAAEEEEVGDGAGGAGAARDDAAGAWDEEEEEEDEEDAFGAQADADADAEADAAAEDAEPAAEEPPFDAAVSLLRRRLLRGEGEVELGGQLQKNYSQLVNMFEDTLRGAQNNSILLLGPRGVGKTLVLRRALATLAARHGGALVPVRLSGLLHADEKTALREVARQLGAPALPAPAEEAQEPSASQAAGASEAAAAAAKRVSVSDNMALMAAHLRTLEGGSRAALFILEEFDLFAAAQHKQMLLYNLLDALQACSVRAAVVGVSVRTDAAELLEKRVRSRFSHRRLVFEPECGARDAETHAACGSGPLLARLLALPPSFPHAAFAAAWNAALLSALADPRAAAALLDAASWDASPRAACAVAMLALSAVTPAQSALSAEHLLTAVASLHRDPFAEALAGATVCELHLLVAAKRLQRLRERPSFNFAAVFEEYSLSMAHALGSHPFPREVALRAFESLAALGVLEPAESGGARGGGWLKEYCAYTLLLSDTEAEQALRQHPQAPTGLADLLRHEVLGATGALAA